MTEEIIIAALEAMGGTGTLQDIYQWVEGNIHLSSYEVGETQWEAYRYQHHVRSRLFVMKRKGQVIQVGRAVYRIP